MDALLNDAERDVERRQATPAIAALTTRPLELKLDVIADDQDCV